MNPLAQTFLSTESINVIAKTFFSKYKNPKTNTIDRFQAEKLIRDIYSSMGIDISPQADDSKDFVEQFSTVSEGIRLEDLQRTFTRYLGGTQRMTQGTGLAVIRKNSKTIIPGASENDFESFKSDN